jgi:hypothetical protein
MNVPLIIVSGLPRSGTSMLMKMLEAGGVEIVTDNLRQPDSDNPNGYFEYEPVKHLARNAAWVHTMRGKALKVISFLLYYLPASVSYQILFMQRDLQEILASQQKMLDRLGQDSKTVSDDVLAQKFATHLQKVTGWIATQKNMTCLYVDYRAVLNDPKSKASEIQQFLQQPLHLENMVLAVDQALYRNRLD